MLNKDNYTDLFDRYIRNELTASERAEFDENLLNNNDFNESFIEHKTLAMGIQDYGKKALKEYLKSQTVTLPKNNFKISKIIYAMAAVLLIFLGIYGVINYNTPKANKTEIAVSETPRNTDSIKETESNLVTESTDKNEPIPSVKKEDDINLSLAENEDINSIKERSDAVEKNAPIARASETDDLKDASDFYEILSDSKLSDTILFATHFVSIDNSTNGKAYPEIETTSKKSLPSNNTYNNKNAPSNKSDTSEIKKQKSIISTDNEKYTIEYWRSPINFKGYKMYGKTIQLFGMNSKQLKIIIYEYRVYLRNGNTFYQMLQCTTGCPFKEEHDTAILNQLMNE